MHWFLSLEKHWWGKHEIRHMLALNIIPIKTLYKKNLMVKTHKIKERSLGVAWSRSLLRDAVHSFSLRHLRNEVCFMLLGVLRTTHGLHV